MLPRPSRGQLLVLRTECMGKLLLWSIKNPAAHVQRVLQPQFLRLSFADTISSATVYSQYVKTLHMQQKHTKFYCHDCRTAARPMTYILTASEDDASQALTEQQDPHSY